MNFSLLNLAVFVESLSFSLLRELRVLGGEIFFFLVRLVSAIG